MRLPPLTCDRCRISLAAEGTMCEMQVRFITYSVAAIATLHSLLMGEQVLRSVLDIGYAIRAFQYHMNKKVSPCARCVHTIIVMGCLSILCSYRSSLPATCRPDNRGYETV
jgi:hypothetical protein